MVWVASRPNKFGSIGEWARGTNWRATCFVPRKLKRFSRQNHSMRKETNPSQHFRVETRSHQEAPWKVDLWSWEKPTRAVERRHFAPFSGTSARNTSLLLLLMTSQFVFTIRFFLPIRPRFFAITEMVLLPWLSAPIRLASLLAPLITPSSSTNFRVFC